MSTPWKNYEKLTTGISSTDTLMIYDNSADKTLQLPIENAMATTTLPGFMSATDKTKLDGIDDSANNYELPNATTDTKGGVIVGDNLTVSDGTLSLTKSNVTGALGYTPTKTEGSSTNGNIVIDDTETTVYTLPNATTSTLGGIKVGSYLSASSGTLSVNLTSRDLRCARRRYRASA